MNNILIDLGFIKITYYAFFILIGAIVSYVIIYIESKKYGYNTEFIGNLVFWVLMFGIVGARLYYVLFNLDYYNANPSEIYKIWNGGLAIHGGIIFGTLTAYIYSKKYKLSSQKIFDIIVVGLIIGQSIGRWGNFFNSEAHGGAITKGALEAIGIIPNFVIKGMNIEGIYYHPTFYYEFLWCLLGFIILVLIRKYYKYLKVGQLTSSYLIWYGIGRYFIEGLRTDSLMYEGFKVAQIVSVVLILIGLITFIKKLLSPRFENLYREEYPDEIKF